MLRQWGRVYAEDGTYTWVPVTTDANGDNSAVYLLDLIQVLKLSRNESPFFANYGIPAQQDVMQQIFPDYYVTLTQQQFAQYFASLQVTRTRNNPPTYRVAVTTKVGYQTAVEIPV